LPIFWSMWTGDHPSTRGMSQIWLEIKEESKFYFL
jgi:hypothetical protein